MTAKINPSLSPDPDTTTNTDWKPEEVPQLTVLLEECFWGEFYRELTINEHLDIDNIKASISNGILTIQIPILQISSQKKIKVDIV